MYVIVHQRKADRLSSSRPTIQVSKTNNGYLNESERMCEEWCVAEPYANCLCGSGIRDKQHLDLGERSEQTDDWV